MCIDAIKETISHIILHMESPFRLFQLYLTLEEQGITDKYVILGVLDQLYEHGLIDKIDVGDDVPEFQRVM